MKAMKAIRVMKAIRSTLLLSLFLLVTGYAQQKTVYLTSTGAGALVSPLLWTKSGGTTANVNYAGSNPNVHTVTVTATSSGGVCATWQLLNVQGSVDNSNWFFLNQYTINAVSSGVDAGNVTRSIVAYGAYPYIRVINATGPGANCALTAAYTGTIGGIIYEVGSITGLTSALIVPGLFNQSNSIVAAGDTTIVGTLVDIGITIYSMTICNTVAAQTVIIKSNGTLTPQLFKAAALTAGQCIVMGNGKTPLFSSVQSTGYGIVVNLANATEVNFTFTYKWE